jgi:hypothetical protein
MPALIMPPGMGMDTPASTLALTFMPSLSGLFLLPGGLACTLHAQSDVSKKLERSKRAEFEMLMEMLMALTSCRRLSCRMT